MQNCAGCKVKITIENLKKVVIDRENNYFEYCRNCINGTPAVPDVYYGYGSGVQTEENIADPKTGDPIPFYDKASKAAAMKMAGVREAGDRVHGSRNEDLLKRKTYFS